MKRIPPSKQIRQEISSLLSEGIRGKENILTELVNKGVQHPRSAISEMTETLWKKYKTFCERDLSGFEVVYLFLDAVYESMGFYRGPKEGILVVWGITREGHCVLLHLMLGNKESYENWRDLLRDMVRRGLKVPPVITSDGAPGLIRAIEEM